MELKEDQQRAEMDLKEVTKENESLRGPLEKSQNTVEELTQKMSNYIKDKQRLIVSIYIWDVKANSFLSIKYLKILR